MVLVFADLVRMVSHKILTDRDCCKVICNDIEPGRHTKMKIILDIHTTIHSTNCADLISAYDHFSSVHTQNTNFNWNVIKMMIANCHVHTWTWKAYSILYKLNTHSQHNTEWLVAMATSLLFFTLRVHGTLNKCEVAWLLPVTCSIYFNTLTHDLFTKTNASRVVCVCVCGSISSVHIDKAIL